MPFALIPFLLLAIPILEWLDSERVTVRQGQERKVLRPRDDG